LKDNKEMKKIKQIHSNTTITNLDTKNYYIAEDTHPFTSNANFNERNYHLQEIFPDTKNFNNGGQFYMQKMTISFKLYSVLE